ncbi:MAG: cation:proton antiporter [Clostridiaceae bacterium]|jgi:Kef-type K+ transport system membrane component KefB|nr:cation:proton antiporter [Clostridiaceae bacterium]
MSTFFYLALILFSGLLFGRIVKQIKLPNVTGYLIAGLLIGPHIMKLIPSETVENLNFISEMALAFIAFSIGSEFKLSYLKKAGATPIVIALFEALLASVLVSGVLIICGFDTKISLLLGAIAAATAPAATIMVVKQYNAKGPVTNTMLSVVALDDAVAIMAFGFAMATVNSMLNPGQSSAWATALSPLIEIFGSIALGLILGLLFNFPLRYFKKQSNRLIITCGFVFLGVAVASYLNLSALLLCMSMGMALVNTSASGEEIFGIVDSVTPPIFLMFFVVSGAELDITVIPKIGVIGILYLIIRVVGKVLGAWLGAYIMKTPDTVRKYIGFTLVPQAGVAIGLSLIASNTLPQYGQSIRAVILCATLIYELTGPVITKMGLKKAGEIQD